MCVNIEFKLAKYWSIDLFHRELITNDEGYTRDDAPSKNMDFYFIFRFRMQPFEPVQYASQSKLLLKLNMWCEKLAIVEYVHAGFFQP